MPAKRSAVSRRASALNKSRAAARRNAVRRMRVQEVDQPSKVLDKTKERRKRSGENKTAASKKRAKRTAESSSKAYEMKKRRSSKSQSQDAGARKRRRAVVSKSARNKAEAQLKRERRERASRRKRK